MADCEKCAGTGWMRIRDPEGVMRSTRCVCRTQARAEREKARPGGFEAIGPVSERVIGSSGDRAIGSLKDGEEPARETPTEAEIAAGDGIKYASARVANLPERIDREIGMLILNRRGKARAISIREICGVLPDLDPRRVKAAVETLRVEARVPIAASKEPPYGYFIPTTAEEARECHDRLFREGVKLILLSQLFKRDADLVRELEGQLKLVEQSKVEGLPALAPYGAGPAESRQRREQAGRRSGLEGGLSTLDPQLSTSPEEAR